MDGSRAHRQLNRIFPLPEVHLLPKDRPPAAKKTPEVAQCTAVKGVLINPTVFEVGDAMARHELPSGGVQRDQIEV